MRQKHRILALVLSFLLLLSACRSSPVLVEERYTQAAPSIAEDQLQLDPEDSGLEDQRFDQENREDLDTQRDTQQAGVQGTANEADEAVAITGSPRADLEPSAPPTASPAPTASASPSPAPAQTSPSPVPASPSPVPAESPAPETPEPSPEPSPAPSPAPDPPARQVLDAAGSYIDLPENVETVAAVGAAAQMTEMLGGTLLGADRAFLSSPLMAAAFPDTGSTACWWEGSGTAGMSEDCFAALLAAKPDACLVLSGQNTFSESQAAQLRDSGIPCVVLYPLSSVENLKASVTIAGEVLGPEAQDTASQYCAWVDELLGQVSSRTSGYSLNSLYLRGWDTDAYYELYNTKDAIEPTGYGLAYAYSPAKAQLMSAMMSAAHVSNESTRIASKHRDSSYVYVTPMFHQFNAYVSGSQAAYYSGAGEYGAAYDLFVARMVGDSAYDQLGSSQFPAVIVRDAETKRQLEGSWFWQYHEASGGGYVIVGDASYYRGVVGTYDIHVSPQGMCDWADGSLESPLAACWVACKLTGTYDMSEVKSLTQDFYRQFFRTELSDPLLSGIFQE